MKISLYPCFKHWEQYEQILLYSDPHFGDIESYTKRGLYPEHSIEELDQMQVDNINKSFSKRSVVVFLGDIGNIEPIKKIRAGLKVLILGNHDTGKTNYQRVKRTERVNYTLEQTCALHKKEQAYFQSALSYVKENKDFVYMSNPFEQPTASCRYFEATYDNRLFDEVYSGPIMLNDKIVLSHAPLEVDGMLNIHGHVHNKLHHVSETDINVCAEAINYKPISLTRILETTRRVPTLNHLTVDRAIANKNRMERRKNELHRD